MTPLAIHPAQDAEGDPFVAHLRGREVARFAVPAQGGDRESRRTTARDAAFLWASQWHLGGVARARAMRDSNR